MSLLESGSWETWKNGVAIQHVANGVKGAWMIQELDEVSTDLTLK